jgi:hypothetical protein
MTQDQKIIVHRTLGFTGSLLGCACTAFAPNQTALKVIGFSGILLSLAALHWMWFQAAGRTR